MKIHTIFTKKRRLKVGDQTVVYATHIPIGAEVVFKNPADPLNPIARGHCIGDVEPLMTPSSKGKTENVNRFYKRLEVTEEA